jgi:alpha-tubulin suppressor-like RCC1 family protein
MTPAKSTESFLSVSAGLDYTCAVSANQKAYCWGSGSNGKLGTGATTSQAQPTLLTTLPFVSAIRAGTVHTCAIANNSDAYCWGEDFTGQIGDGPPTVPNPTAVDLIRLAPVRVEHQGRMALIATGWGQSTCGLDDIGNAWCWGLNTNGQLGTGRHDFPAGRGIRHSDSPTRVLMIP